MRKTLMLTLIASILTMFAIGPAFAYTTLAAPTVIDDTLDPAIPSFFSIEITVADVSAMWGYQFILSYDTSILTAFDYEFLSIFTYPAPSEINDAMGYVAMAANSYPGDTAGLTTVDPVAIARIWFVVDDRGTSVLDLHDSYLANVYGGSIGHVATDGFFDNRLPGTPVASFFVDPAVPEPGEPAVCDASDSYDADGYIVSYEWDFGDGTTETVATATTTHIWALEGVYTVTLKVTDNDGLYGYTSQSVEVKPKPPPPTYAADLVGRAAWPEHRRQSITKHGAEQFLYAKMSNLGTDPTNVKVIFTVYDGKRGAVLGTIETAEQVIPPYPIPFETKALFDANAWGTPKYKVFIEAQLWYDGDGDGVIDTAGAKVKGFGISIVP